MTIQPFQINVAQAVLDDLQQRLANTRMADEVAGAGWRYGTSTTYLKNLLHYWQTQYDWRKHEAELNQLPQFQVDIDGLKIHYVHVRGKGTNPTPLLLTHGWPDSFYRFHKVIPMLADPAVFGGDPAPAFDVIVPSIPGFGFSDRQALPDEKVADLWIKLMRDVLGYDRFMAAGGDVGANVTKALGYKYPQFVSAIHLTEVGYPDQNTDFASLTPAEQEFAGFIQNWWFTEGAYSMVQMTKPQSLAAGLNDSPAGLAAWIMSFVCIGTTGQIIETRFSRDELLTNIMIYWVTETIASSVRMYYESAQAEPLIKPGERIEVPAGVAHAPLDAPLPRAWAERHLNLKHFTDLARGGHFAAWEEPVLYARDIQDFVRSLQGR